MACFFASTFYFESVILKKISFTQRRESIFDCIGMEDQVALSGQLLFSGKNLKRIKFANIFLGVYQISAGVHYLISVLVYENYFESFNMMNGL
jgi:hypothetical protein